MNISVAHGCDERLGTDGTRYRYFDIGTGATTVVLLHGMFGSPSNWLHAMRELGDRYRFLSLQLPIDRHRGRRHAEFESIGQLTDHLTGFLDEMQLDRTVLVGNSLGGQVALDYCLQAPERVERLVLSGSAGLFERSLSGGRPPRVCKDFIRDQACQIFYDPNNVDDAMVDEIYDMLRDRDYRRFLLRVAKGTRDRYMLDELVRVQVPTLIIWGRDDSITPPFVAEQFCDHIEGAQLVFLDQCGHAPPIEQPAEFTRHLEVFLSSTAGALA
ncbi:MAG: alpha/beta hydrolase [Pirellulales bacterium]